MMNEIDFISGKRVLVTGAGGFIGGSLCIRLKELGAEIYAVSTRSQAEREEIDQWITGDLADADFVSSTIKSVQPAIVFHLAGYVTGSRELQAVQPTYHNILTATVNILIASTGTGIRRLVLAGSLEEPDESGRTDIPVSPYAAAKWSASVYARMFHKLYETPVVIPRIFMVYGPGRQNTDKLVPYVIRSMLHQKNPELSSGTRQVDWVYIDDVVEGLVRMAYSNGVEGKSIDLGTGNMHTVREVCERLQSKIDNGCQLIFGELEDRPFERIKEADTDKTEEMLGWKPEVNIDEGLEKTIEWFKGRVSDR